MQKPGRFNQQAPSTMINMNQVSGAAESSNL
jgi:hypothetical protein